MPKTKRETDAVSKRPGKHPKLEEKVTFVPSSLNDINDHCVLEIFKCLSVEDELNSVVVFIAKRYNDLRNHDSLGQTRTGTIVCTGNTTLESTRRAFAAQEWNQVFTGNRTRLKVVDLGRMPYINTRVESSADYLLPNVSCLDMSVTPSAEGETQEIASHRNAEAFATMLPNVEEFDMCYTGTPNDAVSFTVLACRKIKRIRCIACRGQIDMNGSGLTMISDTLTELYLDNSQLMSVFRGTGEAFEDENDSLFLFKHCDSLERLSIKNVSWLARGEEHGDVSQEMLIKMVRNHPTLRWLRSDLSQENIVMLQQERPDVTFVSD